MTNITLGYVFGIVGCILAVAGALTKIQNIVRETKIQVACYIGGTVCFFTTSHLVSVPPTVTITQLWILVIGGVYIGFGGGHLNRVQNAKHQFLRALVLFVCGASIILFTYFKIIELF